MSEKPTVGTSLPGSSQSKTSSQRSFKAPTDLHSNFQAHGKTLQVRTREKFEM